MLAKTVPDFILLALKIAQVLFVTRTRILLFPGTKGAEFQLEKQPHPEVCTPMACPGGDTPALHQIPPTQDAFSPNTKRVGLEKPQCLA